MSSLDVFQRKYEDCLRQGDLESLTSLFDAHTLVPDEALIQKGYAFCIEEGLFDRLQKLQELYGFSPRLDKEFVHFVYRKYDRQGWWEKMHLLRELTGVYFQDVIFSD